MGTSFSGVVSTFRQTWNYQSSQSLQEAGYRAIQEILTQSLNEEFSSNPSAIKEYKEKEFHYYHLTKVDGRSEWREDTLIFNQHPSPGKLIAIGHNTNRPGGGIIKYQCEAIVRGENLVMLRSPRVLASKKVAKEYTVAVFPKMDNPYLSPYYAGIAFKTSFDDEHITVPCLLSEIAIPIKEVEVEWDKAFSRTSQMSEMLMKYHKRGD